MVWYWMVRSHFAIWKLDQNCRESQKLFPVFKCSGRSKTGHRKSCFYESRFQVSGIHFVTVYVLQVSWSTSQSWRPLKYLSHTQAGKNVGLLYTHLLCVMPFLKVSSQYRTFFLWCHDSTILFCFRLGGSSLGRDVVGWISHLWSLSFGHRYPVLLLSKRA